MVAGIDCTAAGSFGGHVVPVLSLAWESVPCFAGTTGVEVEAGALELILLLELGFGVVATGSIDMDSFPVTAVHCGREAVVGM